MIELPHRERRSWDGDTDRERMWRRPSLTNSGQLGGAEIVRWLRFNAVGAIGILVQLSALTLLVRVIRLPIVVATALAVEIAIIHNFIWHRGWTWADRRRGGRSPARFVEAVRYLFRFNLTTGFVSLAGNMLLMPLLAGALSIGLLKANLATIAICSLVNFVVSDRVVFRRRQ